MPAKGQRRKVGNYINVRLSDADIDLINWWKGLPEGAGGEQVKRALRAFIAADHQPATRSDVGEAASWIVGEIEQRQTGQADTVARAIAGLTSQLEGLRRQIANGVQLSGPAAQPADQPALSEEEQARRIQKVKAQKW